MKPPRRPLHPGRPSRSHFQTNQPPPISQSPARANRSRDSTRAIMLSSERTSHVLGSSNHAPSGAMVGPMTSTVALGGLLLRLAALLYSSVVQTGASGYEAVMGLC